MKKEGKTITKILRMTPSEHDKILIRRYYLYKICNELYDFPPSYKDSDHKRIGSRAFKAGQ